MAALTNTRIRFPDGRGWVGPVADPAAYTQALANSTGLIIAYATETVPKAGKFGPEVEVWPAGVLPGGVAAGAAGT